MKEEFYEKISLVEGEFYQIKRVLNQGLGKTLIRR